MSTENDRATRLAFEIDAKIRSVTHARETDMRVIRILTDALNDSAEVKRLRSWVDVLRMDRQMYADIFAKETPQARAEGVEAGKLSAHVDLDRANETIAKMAEIIRSQAALLGHVVDLPIVPADMRAATGDSTTARMPPTEPR